METSRLVVHELKYISRYLIEDVCHVVVLKHAHRIVHPSIIRNNVVSRAKCLAFPRVPHFRCSPLVNH